MAGHLEGFLRAVQPYLEQYGYGALFGCLLLEGFGLPLPGEIMLIAAGMMAAMGKMHIAPVLLTAWVAAVAGNTIGYGIGRKFGRRLLHDYGHWIGIGKRRLARVENFFDRYGGGVIVLARFVAVLRQINGILAGSGNLSARRFFIYNALGAALWVGLWGLGAYWFGTRAGFMLAAIKANELSLLLAIALACLTIVWLWRRRGNN